ncbi:MAG: hypothetical protein WAL45_07845 [Terracidiphilus sp.]
MLRQEDAQAFKLYSQAKLGMMREALAKLEANERVIASTEKASLGISCTFLGRERPSGRDPEGNEMF